MTALFFFVFLFFLRQDEGLAHHFTAVDGCTQCVELLLITGHDAHNAVFVEVPGQVIHLQTACFKLLHGELEEGSIVGLKVDLTVGSYRAAVLIQNALNEDLEIARPRVQKENDNYYLLTKCSNVMVIAECGFLSNPEEETLLTDKEYQQRIAAALKRGICEYLDLQKEPHGKIKEPEEPVI